MGFVNRWSGVQFSHPAPLVLLDNSAAMGLAASSARAESTESGESNVDLPYRKSGHKGCFSHLLGQRSEIFLARRASDENGGGGGDFSDGAGGGAGRKSGHSPADVRQEPAEFYEIVAAHTQRALARADLFSRETRPGFEGWGNEHGKFDATEAA
jgi:hypothetical protein